MIDMRLFFGMVCKILYTSNMSKDIGHTDPIKEAKPLEQLEPLSEEIETPWVVEKMEYLLNDPPVDSKADDVSYVDKIEEKVAEGHSRFAYILEEVPLQEEESNVEGSIEEVAPVAEVESEPELEMLEPVDEGHLRKEALRRELFALFHSSCTHIRPDIHDKYILILHDSSTDQQLSTHIESSKFSVYVHNGIKGVRELIVETVDMWYHVSVGNGQQRITKMGKDIWIYKLNNPITLPTGDCVLYYLANTSHDIKKRWYINSCLSKVIPYSALPLDGRILEKFRSWNMFAQIESREPLKHFQTSCRDIRRICLSTVSLE